MPLREQIALVSAVIKNEHDITVNWSSLERVIGFPGEEKFTCQHCNSVMDKKYLKPDTWCPVCGMDGCMEPL